MCWCSEIRQGHDFVGIGHGVRNLWSAGEYGAQLQPNLAQRVLERTRLD